MTTDPRNLIRFRCAVCGKGVGATVDLAGKQVNCPTCGGTVTVPRHKPNATAPTVKSPSESSKPQRHPKAEQRTVAAKKVARTIKSLAKPAAREGWNVIASVRVVCPSCQSVYRVSPDPDSRGKFRLIAKTGQIYSLDGPFECRQCQAVNLTVTNTKTTLRDWLCQLCAGLQPSEDDLDIGFQDVERGGNIRDHGFQFAGTFEQLWSLIRKLADHATGEVNPSHFDIIWSSGDWRKTHDTHNLIHFNDSTRTKIEVIKDKDGALWFGVEHLR